jgi:serine/threonine protein kinase
MHGASAALRGQKWYFSPVEEGELSTGRVILGRFRLERELGHGGMGTVWAATHTLTGKSLALKFLKASSAGDETARRRFFREARSACAVRHPHVVSVHDVIELDDGAPVMVMDLLEGESLRARLDRENTISLELLRPIVIQVLSALEALHAQGIVHRDLKPDNVFLCSAAGEGVKLLDFGIAKHVARDEASTEGATDTGALTGTGAMLGTPFYMAPEQAFGEKDIDARVDLWAIGIVLYECLAGVEFRADPEDDHLRAPPVDRASRARAARADRADHRPLPLARESGPPARRDGSPRRLRRTSTPPKGRGKARGRIARGRHRVARAGLDLVLVERQARDAARPSRGRSDHATCANHDRHRERRPLRDPPRRACRVERPRACGDESGGESGPRSFADETRRDAR